MSDEHPPLEKPPSLFASLLLFRDFRLLWLGLLVSNLGTWMQFTALGYFVSRLAGSPGRAALDLGFIGLARAVPVLLCSPVAGVIARRSVQVGQRVAAGAPLMALVPLDDVWVDANFKEGQLRTIRIGQRVSLRSDLYGSNVIYRGRIAGLSAGSGSAFALLPAQNASGNWIKIVQRIPVRIVIDAQDLKDHPLRVGLSMSAEVDVRDTSGPVVSKQVRNVPLPTQSSAGDDPQVEQRIADIVAQNAGQGLPTALARSVR